MGANALNMSQTAPHRGSAARLVTDKHALRKLVAEANLAPSLYNTQPVRWSFAPDGTVQIYEDVGRRLPVADPTGRWARMAVGAAFEGLNIALSKTGLSLRVLQLASPECEPDEQHPSLRRVASALITQGAVRDPLAAYVYERHTFRGEFETVNPEARDALAGLMQYLGDVAAITEQADIQALVQEYRQCQEELKQRAGYQAEFYRWVSWTQRESQSRHDGLNIQDMTLGASPHVVRSSLLRSLVHTTLQTLGVMPDLYDETRSILSASAVGVLTGPVDQDAFLSGRRFYRVWLEMCRAGYALCPMLATIDTAGGLQALRQRFSLTQDRQVISFFRVGKAAAGVSCQRRRLPARELLIRKKNV